MLTCELDADEVDIVGCRVDHSPESKRVRDLTMEPDILICGEDGRHFWTDEANDVTDWAKKNCQKPVRRLDRGRRTHWEQDQTTVIGKHQASTPRRPDGPFKTVQRGKLSVSFLWSGLRYSRRSEEGRAYLTVPAISEQEKMRAVEKDVEGLEGI